MIRVLEVNVDDHLYGGVYVLVKNIIANLPSDITADIAALEPFDDEKHIKELESCGSKVCYVGSKRNRIFKQWDIYRNVKQTVEKNRYDVIHFHSDVSHKILISALASYKTTKKLVFHSHADDADGGHIAVRRAFHKLCCIFLKRIPAEYIATSSDAGKWMFPWTKDGQVLVLDNGIDYHRFRYNAEKREAKRRELLIGKNDYLIGLFGRFVPQKNPMYAIRVLKLMLEKDDNVKLLCIGEGPLKNNFRNEMHKQGMDKHVIFLGNTDRIEDYYQAIDALIMPSNFEGFGLVSVESQISGTPTIVSDHVPELTRISDLIQYLPIQDDSAEQWCELLDNAKSYVKCDVMDRIDKKYELQTLVDRIVNIYEH